MSKYKKVRCPNCGKVITESTLEYDFELKSAPTNKFYCSRCKKVSFYTIKQNNEALPKAE